MSFPRQYARTQRLTLGEPRTYTVSPDGRRVVFVRSRGGDDRVNCLWVLDVATGEERLVADPRVLLTAADEADLPAEERARRERAREGAGGVVAYATDAAVTVAAFALGGRLFGAGLISGTAREIPVQGPVFDPRPDPNGRRVAYVSGRTLRIAELDGSSVEFAGEADEQITWGSADFVAAEEMDRHRGFWWSPAGDAIAACRVDNSPVGTWWISDPSQPDAAPTPHRYPAAGTANPDVELWILGLDESTVQVDWDRGALPYLATVRWLAAGDLLISVQSRDQKTVCVLQVDRATGRCTELHRITDDCWVDLVPGSPAILADGNLVVCSQQAGVRRLLIAGRSVTADGLDVRSVVAVGDEHVDLLATPVDTPTVVHLYRWTPMSFGRLTTGAAVCTAATGGGTVVVRRADLSSPRADHRVLNGPAIANLAEEALVTPAVQLVRVGVRDLACAVLFPTGHQPGTRLPVLLDPYGGPGHQRVTEAASMYLTSQWFADQGFAVVVIDGRGTPGRGGAWERGVHLDLAAPVLEDQIDGLLGVAERFPDLDLGRVGIRGWSFGGYLAALAVLRRPDVFHAAVAGAPVTEWRLYDTHYTERFLGNPAIDPAPYDRTSLLADAAGLQRPLLLIHGLADDNVVAAHSLQLSSALMAAGRRHEFLPLAGVSHMTPQEVVAENNLLIQLEFLQDALRDVRPATVPSRA